MDDFVYRSNWDKCRIWPVSLERSIWMSKGSSESGGFGGSSLVVLVLVLSELQRISLLELLVVLCRYGEIILTPNFLAGDY